MDLASETDFFSFAKQLVLFPEEYVKVATLPPPRLCPDAPH
jgi:hypothetical protein